MKRYRCPYCGEKAFSRFNKLCMNPYGHRYRYMEWLHLICPHCGKECVFKATKTANQRYKMLYTGCFGLVIVYFPLYAVWQEYLFWSPIVMCIIFILLTLAITHNHMKYDVYVRKGEFRDVLVPAAIRFNKEHRFVDENIYVLKPQKTELHKVDVFPCYIVAVTSDESGVYYLRFIKPDTSQKMVEAAVPFILYDDQKECGNGVCVPTGQPDKLFTDLS